MAVVEGTFSEKFTLKLWFLACDMKDENDERRQPWNIWVVSVVEKRNNMFKYPEIEMGWMSLMERKVMWLRSGQTWCQEGFQRSGQVKHCRYVFWKERSKIVFIGKQHDPVNPYPKEFTPNLLEPITKFKKIARHKVNSYYLSIYILGKKNPKV